MDGYCLQVTSLTKTNERFAHIPERIGGLIPLAFNLWWSWHPAARVVFERLDPVAWIESVHNPVKMLESVSQETLEGAATDPEFLEEYDAAITGFHSDLELQEGWFADNIADPDQRPVAYFSAEFGLHHSLPFYAGGLGFLAGDFIKEASDLGVPMVAVGFMYPEGYLRQKIHAGGWQEDIDEPLNRDAAPVRRVLDEQGEQRIVQVPFIDPPIHVAIWKADIGRIPLYLMDTDIEINDPSNRRIGLHLYIGDTEQRLRQEIVLGVGGAEMLHALGIEHSISHLNEGHAAFLLLERVRESVSGGVPFDEAVRQVRETSVFTTHTPLRSGTDIFSNELMDRYFGEYHTHLGLDRDAFLKLGAHPEDPSGGFNMTVLALRLTGHHNGVSRRHGETARQIWKSLWPDRPVDQVPIGHVTNGVHVPTWLEPEIQRLLDAHLPAGWLSNRDDPGVWKAVGNIPDAALWRTHSRLKEHLIRTVRERARRRWVQEGSDPALIPATGALLDPGVCTVVFARRFTEYKRPDLILRDPDRLKRMLHDRQRPVQFIFAGKAHPNDETGKRILQKVFKFALRPDMGGRVAFVENYEEEIAQYLMHGADVWLNTPRPPQEASGTSGMKAAINGVLHLSILDGWWVEGYDERNGWAVKHSPEADDPDGEDADNLYRLLETEILPLYYRSGDDGIPHTWVRRMKESMQSTGPRFSAQRMVKEYHRKYYSDIFQEIPSEKGGGEGS